jgi:ABC-type transporter Mla MlaB component
MLRIDIEQHGDDFLVALHGSIAGDWVPLLERHWRSITEKVPTASVSMSLSDVSFVDAAGVRLLDEMARAGVRFEASGCMNRHLVDMVEGRLAAGRTHQKRGRS